MIKQPLLEAFGYRKAGYPLEPLQAERLAAYLRLVIEYNKQINLVRYTTEEEFVLLHGLDFLPLLADPSPAPLVDLGAGAGFTGVPLAICRPGRTTYLLEPNIRRGFFLNLVKGRLDLNYEVVPRDLEGALPSLPDADLVFAARALPKKERVFRRLHAAWPHPHRLALFLGADADAFLGDLRLWYAVDRMIEMPFRENGRLALLHNVSRETWAVS